MSFADVIAPALYHAERGFSRSPRSPRTRCGANVDKYRRWPSSVALYLRDGRAYRMGEVLVLSELADTLKRMVAAEKRAQVARAWRASARPATSSTAVRRPSGSPSSIAPTRGRWPSPTSPTSRSRCGPALRTSFGAL